MSILEIKGRKIEGQKLGAKLGFPTINLDYDGDLSGVFAGKVYFGDDDFGYLAAVNLGYRPTLNDERKFCEAHLIDWGGVVEEDCEITVKILKKIREVKKFPTLDDLKEQIAKDVELAKKMLSSGYEKFSA